MRVKLPPGMERIDLYMNIYEQGSFGRRQGSYIPVHPLVTSYPRIKPSLLYSGSFKYFVEFGQAGEEEPMLNFFLNGVVQPPTTFPQVVKEIDWLWTQCGACLCIRKEIR